MWGIVEVGAVAAEVGAGAEGSPGAEMGLECCPSQWWNLPVHDLRRNAVQHGLGRQLEICL